MEVLRKGSTGHSQVRKEALGSSMGRGQEDCYLIRRPEVASVVTKRPDPGQLQFGGEREVEKMPMVSGWRVSPGCCSEGLRQALGRQEQAERRVRTLLKRLWDARLTCGVTAVALPPNLYLSSSSGIPRVSAHGLWN